jgi:hypothetical protein
VSYSSSCPALVRSVLPVFSRLLLLAVDVSFVCLSVNTSLWCENVLGTLDCGKWVCLLLIDCHLDSELCIVSPVSLCLFVVLDWPVNVSPFHRTSYSSFFFFCLQDLNPVH